MKYYRDLAEQTAASYLLTFLGLLLTDGMDLTSVSALKAAAVAAIPAALMVVKGAAARKVGDPDSANFLS